MPCFYPSFFLNPATPSVLALSRQNCRHLEGSSADLVAKGAYTLCEHGPGSAPEIILAATGECCKK